MEKNKEDKDTKNKENKDMESKEDKDMKKKDNAMEHKEDKDMKNMENKDMRARRTRTWRARSKEDKDMKKKDKELGTWVEDCQQQRCMKDARMFLLHLGLPVRFHHNYVPLMVRDVIIMIDMYQSFHFHFCYDWMQVSPTQPFQISYSLKKKWSPPQAM